MVQAFVNAANGPEKSIKTVFAYKKALAWEAKMVAFTASLSW